MKNQIRLLAGITTFAGAALLVAPGPAHATMALNPLDAGKRFCCAVDTDGDRRSDTLCCFNTGCSVDATGCRRETE